MIAESGGGSTQLLQMYSAGTDGGQRIVMGGTGDAQSSSVAGTTISGGLGVSKNVVVNGSIDAISITGSNAYFTNITSSSITGTSLFLSGNLTGTSGYFNGNLKSKIDMTVNATGTSNKLVRLECRDETDAQIYCDNPSVGAIPLLITSSTVSTSSNLSVGGTLSVTSSSTASFYYSANDVSVNFENPWSSAKSTTFNISRSGDLVSIQLKAVSALTTAENIYNFFVSTSAPIPSSCRPLTDTIVSIPILVGTSVETGYCEIGSDGYIAIYRIGGAVEETIFGLETCCISYLRL